MVKKPKNSTIKFDMARIANPHERLESNTYDSDEVKVVARLS